MVRQEKILLAWNGVLSVTPSLILLFISLLFTSCGNDINTVNSITQLQAGPSMSAVNIEIQFSEGGKRQAILRSPLLNRYDGDKPYLDFPKGFRIDMFDSLNRPVTSIVGNYGKKDESTNIMEAKGNVVVRNEVEKKQLNTEHLIWDQNRQLIYSDVKIKITTPDKVLFGSGIKSNETFSWYQIPNASATMTVDRDSI